MIENIADSSVGPDLDRELRQLLVLCFPDTPQFREHRHYLEPPRQRWFIRENGQLVGHVCLHRKTIGSTQGDLQIGGIAEVCIRPTHRGRGLVHQMLHKLHEWDKNSDFQMLFGKERIYHSSGYQTVHNPLRYFDTIKQEWITQTLEGTMIRPAIKSNWPAGPIDLRGPIF
ncbi:MAG: GNAT family N-acetyltransferase [Phycisphaerales bacterium]|jgi:predicted acetyltransferase|nr:GNAT family N-acetyltransferase [Phycisphaerales bacterium]